MLYLSGLGFLLDCVKLALESGSVSCWIPKEREWSDPTLFSSLLCYGLLAMSVRSASVYLCLITSLSEENG